MAASHLFCPSSISRTLVSLLLNLSLILALNSLTSGTEFLTNRNASLGRTVAGNVSRGKEDVWLYQYPNSNETQVVRVYVNSSKASAQFPLLFVARLQRSVLSWPIPEESFKYPLASRILCPYWHSSTPDITSGKEGTEYFSIDVSSSSPQPVEYNLMASFVKQFELKFKEKLSLTINPAEPMYFLFKYPEGIQTVVVKAESNSSICAILSVQGAECPVYDLSRNVEFSGYFQTMTTKAAITMQNSTFRHNMFFVVIIVKSSDTECVTGERFVNPHTKDSNYKTIAEPLSRRQKKITLIVEPTLSETDYVRAIALPICMFGLFYVVAFFLLLGSWCRDKNRKSFLSVLMPGISSLEKSPDDSDPDGLTKPLRTSSSNRSREHYGSTMDDDDSVTVRNDQSRSYSPIEQPLKDIDDETNYDETNYDMLHDIEHEKDIYRLKTSVMLSDLSKKSQRFMMKKYKLYHWNLVIIAVFYALPVVQLVVTYQKVLNASGDQDICYYNFFCAHPLGVFSAFNNVYSNIGYIMLGFLFFLVVLRRDRLHQKAVAARNPSTENRGIPEHYGIFYAMALALMMEGVLSACYHVCPNDSNFQFDTSFMYIITCLGIVKVYQTRHTDITANAHTVYAAFAGIILIAMLGVLYSTFAFWATFCIIHILVCLYLSTQMYYMARVRFDAGIFTRVFVLLRYDCCSCPSYKDRMLLLIVVNAVNWGLAINGVVNQPNDFATYLLGVFIVNGILYVGFYVVMKLRNKERILPLAIVVMVLTLSFWVAALYFFLQHLTSWQVSPAQSRAGNKDCALLSFYDDHDVWHFLSACSLFLMFVAVLILDDDLINTPRNKIPVF